MRKHKYHLENQTFGDWITLVTDYDRKNLIHQIIPLGGI